MRLALELAELGRGFTSPNPLVGAVITRGDRIVGVGYHRRYGEKHAEVRAIEDAGGATRGATMYVTLEPHPFHGHQPPCTEAVISAGIRRVVIGALDPNPRVRGRGVKRLKEAGLDVVVGVLEEEVREQNEVFFTFHEKGRPFVVLKLAQTLDGRIGDRLGNSKWITSEEARRRVHLLRSYYDAVLIGAGTLRKDDPLLTVRHVYTERQPLRVVLTRSGRLPPVRRVYNTDAPTLVLHVNPLNVTLPENVKRVRFSGDLEEALGILRDMSITSVMVEGGGEVFTRFLKAGLFDRVYAFVAPKLLGEGVPPFLGGLEVDSALRLKVKGVEILGEDVLITLKPP